MKGECVISLFEEQHNYSCETPSKVHLLPSHRKVDKLQGVLIDQMSKLKGEATLVLLERDLQNHIQKSQTKSTERGYAECLLDYLHMKRDKNPKFFHKIPTRR